MSTRYDPYLPLFHCLQRLDVEIKSLLETHKTLLAQNSDISLVANDMINTLATIEKRSDDERRNAIAAD
ncbi:uncharacterized protein VTP21DRAFT_11605 [Calcarisporiella thermophila]|uniref:uncharacterized protein n=1 Tax=Calcarisporiella thermophila TaxID=911321 RepID=UPI003742881C